MLGWIDIETTGLDTKKDCILEVACLVTDDNLNPVDAGLTVLMEPFLGCLEQMDPYVRDMHEKSGLLALVSPSESKKLFSVEQAEQHLMAYFIKHQLDPIEYKAAEKMPMAGASVHFDRSFLKEHMPLFEKMFHYRNFDVSTITQWVKRRSPNIIERRPKKETAHRAMLDVVDTIDLMKFYNQQVVFLREANVA